jgi:hypothetical protein
MSWNDGEESSICRKTKIPLNEIDIPDWTSIVFNRLRWNKILDSISIWILSSHPHTTAHRRHARPTEPTIANEYDYSKHHKTYTGYTRTPTSTSAKSVGLDRSTLDSEQRTKQQKRSSREQQLEHRQRDRDRETSDGNGGETTSNEPSKSKGRQKGA